MPYDGFECKQCGHCCTLSDAYQGSASEADVKMWEDNDRWDILDWVSTIYGKNGEVFCHDIWISPTTHDWVNRCPWLRKLPNKDKYICRIHDMKPELCRNYPLDKEHAEKTSCGLGIPKRK